MSYPSLKSKTLSFMTTNEEEDVVEVDDIKQTTDDDGNDTTDWKAIAEERQALALKNQGIAKRYKTAAQKAKDSSKKEEVKEPPADNKSGELDKGDKALLVAYGIKGADEFALAKSWINRTGDEIDSMVEDDIFQAKLTKLREAKASTDAVPKGNKRGTGTAKGDVDFWVAKGELPPNTAENQQLRRDVVAARLKASSSASNFADVAVIK